VAGTGKNEPLIWITFMSEEDKERGRGFMTGVFLRNHRNPLITADDMPYLANTVFNAGVADLGDEVVLVLRVESCSGRSHLIVARSEDGIGGWEIDNRALLHPSEGYPHEENGVEDCRVTWMEELGCWYLVYTAYGRHGPGIGIAKTTDFKSVERLGVVIPPNNKNAALFPCTFDGYYAMLIRETGGSVWLTYSPDLKYWGNPQPVLPPRGGPWWDNIRVGAGLQPLRTEDGWLLIYHGVKELAKQPIYRIGGALTDIDEPHQLTARCRRWLLTPKTSYERMGDAPNVIFSCGGFMREGTLWMYYGAADSCVCLATASKDDVLDVVEEEKV